MTQITPDYSAIKQRQQKMWSTGDFSAIGKSGAIVGELLCEAVDLNAGERVLDVATGPGGTAIAAARRECDVTGIDWMFRHCSSRPERAAAGRDSTSPFRKAMPRTLTSPTRHSTLCSRPLESCSRPTKPRLPLNSSECANLEARSDLPAGHPMEYPGEMFRLSAKYLSPPPDSNLRCDGEPSRASGSCSATVPPPCSPRRRCFGRVTVRRTKFVELFCDKFGPVAMLLASLDEGGRQQFQAS